MKRSNILLVGVLSILVTAGLMAQTTSFDARFDLITNNGSVFDIKIRVKANGAPFNMGTASLIFTYNNVDLGTPTLLTAHNFSGGNYATMSITTAQPPRVIVNIDLNNPPGTPVPLTFTDVVTLRFPTLNVNGNSQLQWVRTGGAPTVVFSDAFVVIPIGTLTDTNHHPLPVQLSRFIATVVNQRQVRLDWTTISEVNNYGFYVERRRNNDSTFTEIPNSFIAGHGTTNERHDYTFTDPSPGAASVSYRLRQVDLDGTVHYTEPIQVSGILTSVDGKEVAPIEFALKQNYPNPFNPSTEIKFSVGKLERTTLEIFNIIGQRVATLFDDVAEPGQYYRVKFDASTLASGIYLYRLQSGKKSDLKKLLLVK